MTGKDELTVVLNLRISPEDAARLDDFGISKSHVARVCMRLGLAQVEADRTLLLSKPVPKAGRPKKSPSK